MNTDSLPEDLPLYSNNLPEILDQVDVMQLNNCFLRLKNALKTHLPGIKVLAVQSPYLEIREVCASFLKSLDIVLPRQSLVCQDLTEVSAFLSSDRLREMIDSSLSAEHRALFEHVKQTIFLCIGRVPRYEVVLGTHPLYLEQHHELLGTVFHSESALPGKWTYYLAFMAASAHQCEYLMSLEQELCCLSGGDSEWFHLDSLSNLPKKIQAIGSLNVKLAHRPWELTVDDLKLLLTTWTVSELAEAIVVICTFHTLSSLVLGLGVLNEYDLPSPRRKEMSVSVALGNLHKPEVMAQLREQSEHFCDGGDEEEADDQFQLLAGGPLTFMTYTRQGSRLYPSDFNWRDHGYAMLERLLPRVAPNLNALREYIYRLVMESSRWRAVWIYTQRLYGLEYDDYNYREVNTVLTKSTKTYLKKVACLPHEVTVEDWSGVDLPIEEKVFLAMVVCEARREGELLYALHALRLALQSL